MNKKEERVVELWGEYRECLRERKELEKTVGLVKKQEEAIKEELKGLIPVGKEKGGVLHTGYEKRSVSYGKYSDWVVEKFVPKGKREEAREGKGEFVSVLWVDQWKAVE